MPRRPPKRWFDRCTSSVESRGGAADPNAVCGAVWSRKPQSEKTQIASEERPMAAKKKKKSHGKRKGTKLHGAALAAWNRKHHPKKKAPKRRRSKKKHTGGARGPSLGEFLKGIRKTASGR
jgi:hypothetical protein